MKKSLFLVLLLVIGITVSAQWSTNPAVNNVISDLSGEQVLSKIGVCSDGNIYIAFFSNQTGFYNVRIQKLDSQGNELWPHNGILVFNDSTDSWVSDWDMAVDATNHAVLTFSEVENGNWNTVAYRISPSGESVWGVNGVALSNNAEMNAAPKVICTPAGNSIFAWSSGDIIIMQKLNAAGQKQWGLNGINVTTANRTSWPQLMPVGNDDFIMKYFDDSGSVPYPVRTIYAQRYNSAGNGVWSSPALVSDAGGISGWNQIFPFINDGSDGFYIAWHDDRDNNLRASVFVQHVNSSGQVVYPADGVEASTASSFNHFYPYLACPPNSTDVYVFWNEMNTDQDLNGIFGQKISSSGNRMWGNTGMTFIPLTAATITPWGAEYSPDDMVLLYSEGDAVNENLKAMRIATDGSFAWPAQFITISSAVSSKVHIELSEFNNGQWIVSWEDNRVDSDDIYAQNFSIDGTLGPYQLTYGIIQGHVTLTGGNGNVTQVIVSAGTNSTLPDPSGDYILNVETGTLQVTASLNGYYPDTVNNVIVLENQTTNNVDFELISIPTSGYIEGTVEIMNGAGDVTQVLVSAGEVTTNPDATGHYSMEVGVGTWDVSASLEGYLTQTRSNVAVLPGDITPGIDFQLSLLPTTGFLYGTVTIEGDMADVTQAVITAGSISVSPDPTGDYLLELPVGDMQVTIAHPYTQSDTAMVNILPGGSTNQDFQLLMLRRDMVVKAISIGTYEYLYGTEVSITGPEQTYTGIIENDSLVFSQVPYGHYLGEANYMNSYSDTADTTIDQNNQNVNFFMLIESAKSDIYQPLLISPNPVSATGTLEIKTDRKAEGTLFIYNSFGRKVSEIYLKTDNQQNFPVTLLFNKQNVEDGIYFLHFVSGNEHFMSRLIIKN